MNRLVGDYVDVVVTFKKCRGFGFMKNPIGLAATLCGKKYECTMFKAVENATFHHQFNWKVSKAEVKKMRSGREIVRIDCFTKNSKGQRETLAFLVLNVRCADIVTGQIKKPMILNWKKLVGGPSSVTKPELLMSFCVKERNMDKSRSSDTLDEPSSAGAGDDDDDNANKRVTFAGTGSLQW